jgi:flagellar motor switch protein FliM
VQRPCGQRWRPHVRRWAPRSCDQPQGVAREVLPALGIAQNLANAVEKALESSGRRSIDLDIHEVDLITRRSRAQLRHLAATQAIEMIQLGRSLRRS